MTKGAAHSVEKSQVAWLELFLIDLLGSFGLFCRAAREEVADGILINGTHKAAAIKARLSAGAPEPIGNADHSHGGVDEARGVACYGLAHGVQIGAQPSLSEFLKDDLERGVRWLWALLVRCHRQGQELIAICISWALRLSRTLDVVHYKKVLNTYEWLT